MKNCKKCERKMYDPMHQEVHELAHMYAEKPTTAIEALNELYEFFEADMWYAKGAEWKTEDDMIRYLKSHFKICMEQIEELK